MCVCVCGLCMFVCMYVCMYVCLYMLFLKKNIALNNTRITLTSKENKL